MTREEIQARVQEVLRSEFDLDSEHVLADARLQEDLDLDSIDLVALAMRLEQELGLLLKEDGLRRLFTVEDVVRFVFDLQAPVVPIRRPG
jgi:acyl carrier protein